MKLVPIIIAPLGHREPKDYFAIAIIVAIMYAIKYWWKKNNNNFD